MATAQAFTARHRYARLAARKARLAADEIRGKDVNQAIELPRSEWPAFVERACGGDAGLATQLKALLDNSDTDAAPLRLGPDVDVVVLRERRVPSVQRVWRQRRAEKHPFPESLRKTQLAVGRPRRAGVGRRPRSGSFSSPMRCRPYTSRSRLRSDT